MVPEKNVTTRIQNLKEHSTSFNLHEFTIRPYLKQYPTHAAHQELEHHNMRQR
jgi:hypothetical protein